MISWPIPMHKQKALNLDKFNLPNTEALSKEVLSLPCYPEMEDWQIEYVVKTVLKFFA